MFNAIIHNDYTTEVSPKFELFSDRLEITSAGALRGIDEYEFFEGFSVPINKELMRVFRDIGLVEQLGSGIPRILSAYEKDIFHFSSHFLRVIFPFSTPQATPQLDREQQLLIYCHKPRTRQQIQDHLGLKDREYLRKEVLKPLLASNKLALTIPDKPTSPKQQFYTVNNAEDQVVQGKKPSDS